MTNIFYHETEKNLFDNLVIDVKKLYEDYPIEEKIEAKPNLVPLTQSPFHTLYHLPFIPKLYRRYLWHIFKQTNLDITWFREFRSCYGLNRCTKRI